MTKTIARILHQLCTAAAESSQPIFHGDKRCSDSKVLIGRKNNLSQSTGAQLGDIASRFFLQQGRSCDELATKSLKTNLKIKPKSLGAPEALGKVGGGVLSQLGNSVALRCLIKCHEV